MVAAVIIDQMADARWRLNNLYSIVDKDGNVLQFRPNWAQQELLDDIHNKNLVLKARQLGFTTLIQLVMLDASVFTPNIRCGTIAHTLADAQIIFRDKVKFPYDNLPAGIRSAVYPLTDSTMELRLANNSSVRVGTSMRSGTLQYLHVSEYGKICAKFPEKAREIKSGALNTLGVNQRAFIESTAEGQEGDFYRMCEESQARDRRNVPNSKLDFKFHFFAWWGHDEYGIDPEGVEITQEMAKYFQSLEDDHGIVLTARQKAWYVRKQAENEEDMKREYPSTPKEAFEASVEGAYYGKQLAKAETDGRITRVPYDEGHPVETWWDIGYSDEMAIWFVQRIPPNSIHVIDYAESHGEGMKFYADMLDDRRRSEGYKYGDMLWPHDGKQHILDERGRTLSEVMEDLGYKPTVTQRSRNINDGIQDVRTLLGRCWFDAERCAKGISALKNYRKEWDEALATWKSSPRHDWASHPSDAFRTGASHEPNTKFNYKKHPGGSLIPKIPIA